MKVEQLTPGVDRVGESGHWDVSTGTLLWINIPGKEIKRINNKTKEIKQISTDKSVSFAVPRSNGQGLVIGQVTGVDFINETTGKQTQFVSHQTLGSAEHVNTNDGKCDAKGRLWFGTYEMDPAVGGFNPSNGLLHSVTPDGTHKCQASGLKLPNGLDWTVDNKTMFLADTFDKCVYAFDFDLEKGEISRQRKVLDFSESDVVGMPDGLTLDSNDKLWLAFLAGSRVDQYDITTGKILQTVDLSPTSSITCPNFGGEKLDELYITTGQVFLSPEQLEAQPAAGSVLRVTGLGVKGKLPNLFAG